MSRPQKWTKERCKASAKQFTTRGAWAKGDTHAYSAARRYGWVESCCKHMCKLKQKWTIEKCLASAKKFSTRSDWQKGDKNAYITAHRRGWLEDCCAHMHKLKQQWTKERCMASAQQFNTRLDWHLGDSGAYSAAHRYGWFEDCCTHMKTKKNVQPQKWTKEKCLVSANKFMNPGDWRKGDKNAYDAARRHDWFEECCAHMSRK